MNRAWLLLVTLALASGCIGEPHTPDPIVYFRLDGRVPDATPDPIPAGLPLRIRPVRAAPYIGERIVWSMNGEVGFYEDRKWCEPPAETVERALAHELFVNRGFVSAQEKTPSLAVEVAGFEEVVAPRHEARVTLLLAVRDEDGRSLAHVRIDEVGAVSGTAPAAFVRAMESTLEAAIEKAVAAVSIALERPPATPSPSDRVGEARPFGSGLAPRGR